MGNSSRSRFGSNDEGRRGSRVRQLFLLRSGSAAQPESSAESEPLERLSAIDLLFGLSVSLAGLLYTLPGIFMREYYRHTEADRTLIGWEMMQRGDYIIPRLLGDYYLTKPPVFYDLLGLSFRLFGTAEYAARLVTVAAVCLLLPTLYFFYRAAGLGRKMTLLSVAIVGLCVQFYEYSVIAEIDLTYVFFCSVAVGSVYLSAIRSRRAAYAAIGGVFLTLAFFTKGPPVLVFYFSALGGVWLCNRLASPRRGTPPLAVAAPNSSIDRRWFFLHTAVLLAVAGLIGLWLIRLSHEVGWKEIRAIFNTEVLVRFIRDSKAEIRDRGHFFYLGSLLGGFMPWTLLLVGRWGRGRERASALFRQHRKFIIFCAGVIVPSLLVFSLASGKSNRYMLPVYPFVAPLLAFCGAGLPQMADKSACRRLLSGAVGAAALLLIGSAIYLTGVPIVPRMGALFFGLAVLAAYTGYLWSSRADWSGIAAGLALCLVCSRYPYSVFFDLTRNKIYSIKPVAAAIEQEVPPGSPVYILELFERWLPYYMKRDGVETLRLTPELARKLELQDGEIYVLLTEDYEAWRTEQLLRGGASFTVVGSYDTAKYKFSLLRIRAKDAALFKPRRAFATVPSRPY